MSAARPAAPPYAQYSKGYHSRTNGVNPLFM